MRKHSISLVKLLWYCLEGMVSCCVLKFKYRLIAWDSDLSRVIAKDSGMLARDINNILEKAKGGHERRKKK